MKSMEQFGKPLVKYAGVANFKVEEQDYKVEGTGNFEAAQFPSGRIAASVVPTDIPRPGKVSLQANPECELSFEGQDSQGWSLKPGGEMFFSRVHWLFAPMARQPDELSLGAQYIAAKRKNASEDGYSKTRFLISNLLWHRNDREQPEPIRLTDQGFEIVITPIDDYLTIAPRLRATRGIEPTALVSIKTSSCEQKPLGEFQDFIDNLLCVFRLATGNLINWYYGEAIDDRTQSAVERVHSYTTTSPYSNTIRFRPLKSGYESLVPKLSLDALTTAFFNDSAQCLDKATLNTLIGHFTNACDPSLSLEATGLLASTLAELIAAKYANAKGESETILQKHFKVAILPALRAAIKETALSQEIKDHVLDHLTGAYRSTFHDKLKSLNDDRNLGLKCSDLRRIVRLRNSLVHRGTYPSAFDCGGWLNDYQFLTWTNFIALCRLLGYEGELPEFLEGHPLEI
ncbi:MAG: hypothetical protein OXG46_11700 [Chloroflexi bacterium]|nr:hypothetical protein [Chloroflexota bacterium]MCY3937918.1 hypothetical protein [Chloroflexota bacterium]